MPERIQRKRTAGWRMPEDTIYVGRPTKWGNPLFVVGGTVCGRPWSAVREQPLRVGVRRVGDEVAYSCHAPAHLAIEHAVDLFRTYCNVERRDYPDEFAKWLTPLRGHDLACWCSLDAPCHADVLLEIANA
ncbi:DUF4326 domain-containing protein [Mycolicibacterium conceptionense]|uniref:DUF4326 domain-containing protein n=1 Tax=Mycolicibacterium conceptionense TaxID=451644 RepID=UPI0005C28903|nr:DUF4326 domain-containing protein [Mycolicibacterium conceptionense]